MSESNKPRTIKLFCPSVSKLVQFVAWEEQRLDLGSIAGAFGLNPSTVKLNGHFISRGVDLVSSSVTWRSLLSFFSSKGYSTGKDDRDVLIVDGKFSKVGSKRAHDPQDDVNGIHCKTEPEEDGICRRSQPGDLLKNKRLRDSSSGHTTDFPGRNNKSSTTSSTPFKCSFVNGNMKRTREDEVVAAGSCKRIR